MKCFDPETGVIPASGESFSSVFGDELCKIAAEDKRVLAVTAAMPSGTGLTEFSKSFPKRFFDVGICEGHAVSMIGGAAHQGCVPVFAVYSTFLQRSYDMIMQDVAMDVGFLTSAPNMTVWSPSSFAELRDMLRYAVFQEKGPVAVRYPKGAEGGYRSGGAEPVKVLERGGDFTLVTYGISVNTALAAAEELKKRGTLVDIIKLGRTKPIELGPIDESVRRTGRLLVLEETAANGCIGQQVAAELLENGVKIDTLILKNTGDRFIPHGSVEELRRYCGIDEKSVCEAIFKAVRGEGNGKDQA